jgi:3-isopropylmalate dehydrogenase
MKKLKFAVLAGDYIGPEVMAEALRVLDHVARQEDLTLELPGRRRRRRRHRPPRQGAPRLHAQALRAVRRDPLRLGRRPKWEKLPPKEQPERAALLTLRKHFTLFANIRPGLLYRELPTPPRSRNERIPNGIDIVCIRELTGGIYFGQPKDTTDARRRRHPGRRHDGLSQERDRSASPRWPSPSPAPARKSICSVDKANVLETSVLWRKTVTAYLAKHAPEIALSTCTSTTPPCSSCATRTSSTSS